jgi:hypothetical protein
MDRLKGLMDSTTEYIRPKGGAEYGEALSYSREFSDDVESSINKQYVHREDEDADKIRLSTIGKLTARDILAGKFKINKASRDATVSEKLRLTFSIGDYIESWVSFTFKRIGYKIIEQQTELTWLGVKGHIDFIIEDEYGVRSIIEVKSANDYYYARVNKYGVHDDRGYLTQLSTYQQALNGMPAYWLFVNKNDSNLSLIKLDPYHVTTIERLERAKKIVEAYHACNSIDDIWTLTRPQPPSLEMYQGRVATHEDGSPRMYVPNNVLNPNLHYVTFEGRTTYGKPRTYVSDYYYPTNYRQNKRNILEDIKL